MSFAGIPPTPTIYVNNLNDKLKKQELKKNLYLLFCQYGNVLEIHCAKTTKMRGQAWIIFEALSGATRALRELQEFDFFGKNMKVSYAKNKSFVTAKMDGTFKPRPKRKGESAIDAAALIVTEQPVQTITETAKPTKKRDTKPDGAANRARDRSESEEEANKILFVEHLPAECTTMMLSILFQQYTGYKEARLVTGKAGIAFVEFTEASQAAQARESLQGFKITPTNLMKITYARQ